MIKMLAVLMLSFLSMSVFSEEKLAQDNSYKTELLRYSHLIGPLDNLAVSGYTSNKDNTNIEKFNNKILDTNKKELNIFTYYPDNKHIEITLIYGYGKLYEVYFILYTEPSSLVSEYYRKDLNNYLTINGFKDPRWLPFSWYDTDEYIYDDISIKSYFPTRSPASISLTKPSMHDEYLVYAQEKRSSDEKKKNEEQNKKLNNALKIN